MVLPTMWDLLIPNLTFTTIIGVILVILGFFNNIVIVLIDKLLKLLSFGSINLKSIRAFMILIGVLLIWLPSIISDFLSTTDGKLLLAIIVVGIFMLFLLFNRFIAKGD